MALLVFYGIIISLIFQLIFTIFGNVPNLLGTLGDTLISGIILYTECIIYLLSIGISYFCHKKEEVPLYKNETPPVVLPV